MARAAAQSAAVRPSPAHRWEVLVKIGPAAQRRRHRRAVESAIERSRTKSPQRRGRQLSAFGRR